MFGPGDDTEDVEVEAETSDTNWGDVSFQAGNDTWVVVEATDTCVTFNAASDGK